MIQKGLIRRKTKKPTNQHHNAQSIATWKKIEKEIKGFLSYL